LKLKKTKTNKKQKTKNKTKNKKQKTKNKKQKTKNKKQKKITEARIYLGLKKFLSRKRPARFGYPTPAQKRKSKEEMTMK
jgi:hypothetical protein